MAEMCLPSDKSLWTAETQADWEREYSSKSKYQQPTFGDLLLHDAESIPFGTPLDMWLAQMDQFGTMVMAASTLVDAAR